MRGETVSRVRVRKPMKSYWRRFVVYWSKVVGLMVHPALLRSCVRSGVEVSVNRVARLMQKARLSACAARKFVRSTRCSGRAHGIVDRVNREFNVSEPDQLWVADATYLHTLDGVLYLAVVQDACSRRILGWSMKTCQDVGLISEALQMALRGRSCEGVIHHSDQGVQYSSKAFQALCRSAWDQAVDGQCR